MTNRKMRKGQTTGTCFITKIYAPSSSLLQGKHLLFSPSPLCLNIFRLFVILSLTQSYQTQNMPASFPGLVQALQNKT
jgi:hypothetical protein